MRFRYYITNTFNGCVEGTNDIERAEELADWEEFFVVDADTGQWLNVGGERLEIEESK